MWTNKTTTITTKISRKPWKQKCSRHSPMVKGVLSKLRIASATILLAVSLSLVHKKLS
jgi:hypothetical protein